MHVGTLICLPNKGILWLLQLVHRRSFRNMMLSWTVLLITGLWFY